MHEVKARTDELSQLSALMKDSRSCGAPVKQSGAQTLGSEGYGFESHSAPYCLHWCCHTKSVLVILISGGINGMLYTEHSAQGWACNKHSNLLLLLLWLLLLSVQFIHSVVSDSFQPYGLQHARPPCPSPTPAAYSDSCPSSQWCHYYCRMHEIMLWILTINCF